ncbi:hypothetical protein COV81_04705 [Candidatus Peregrinibacteria bacterium CG11_big_fil_rev_8_21_14_0_20_41_10]|nr:MAG: hypothetical protein COV81_04705 [Candidatus Peregrinibacteria bacterium CG11_big_fil_rev_8_21_14_0_20_41_10]PIZ74714.1 MAG: hypothetical protein COY06_03760 [Candidatus Peregrinibacteria bacterium CG_4_10_14_0_2_um_filter_41_8]PJC37909.1 MAG: hypothetical protein CO045_03125 [Candidatus Peregrinibacteria bacterium CG_4_9_14_0_2_um_filter_41_14]
MSTTPQVTGSKTPDYPEGSNRPVVVGVPIELLRGEANGQVVAALNEPPELPTLKLQAVQRPDQPTEAKVDVEVSASLPGPFESLYQILNLTFADTFDKSDFMKTAIQRAGILDKLPNKKMKKEFLMMTLPKQSQIDSDALLTHYTECWDYALQNETAPDLEEISLWCVIKLHISKLGISYIPARIQRIY